MRILNLVLPIFLATTAGCFPATHDKNGNPYSQVPGRGVECSWMTQKTLGCPEIIGPVQKGPLGQTCQTLKRGNDYETRCDNGVLPPNPY
ncbi:MAG: hypothetical protein OJF50_004042 [Nitrospira sp.]|jgi:hypothetical protein|nr:hypothetical protein [Nitrospira sp.]